MGTSKKSRKQNPAKFGSQSRVLFAFMVLAGYNSITATSGGLHRMFGSETFRDVNNFFDFTVIDFQDLLLSPFGFLPRFVLGLLQVVVGVVLALLAVAMRSPLKKARLADLSSHENAARLRRMQTEERERRRAAERDRRAKTRSDRESVERFRPQPNRVEREGSRGEERSVEPVAQHIKAPQVNEHGYQNQKPPQSVPRIDLGLLDVDFPRRADELRARQRLVGDLSSGIQDVALKVWKLASYWLIFLDGDDFGLSNNRDLYAQVAATARTLGMSIERMAGHLMEEVVVGLFDFEISLALLACADTVGEGLKLNGNVDDTFAQLVRARERANPLGRRAQNGIADTRWPGLVAMSDPDEFPSWTRNRP